MPQRVLIQRNITEAPERHEREMLARCTTLAQIELFGGLTDGERRALAAELADCPYVTNDVIARQGEAADSLFILARGRVGVYDDSAGGTGARDHLATLEAPILFRRNGAPDRAGAGGHRRSPKATCCAIGWTRPASTRSCRARPALVEPMSRSRHCAPDGQRRPAAGAVADVSRPAPGVLQRGRTRPAHQELLRDRGIAGRHQRHRPAMSPPASAGTRCRTTRRSRATRTATADTRVPRRRDCGRPPRQACLAD